MAVIAALVVGRLSDVKVATLGEYSVTRIAADYRRELDGLRAIAIASVVAYHVGIPGIRGGFAGVDVFFVISGYLITSLLLKEKLERGSIDLLGFYARRARRLLPAFFVVLVASTAAAVFLLLPLPEEMGEFARSARFAALYASNVHFAQSSSGYFAAPTELMPLLHTWSLAVEEQFYIAWPVLMIVGFLVAGYYRGSGRLFAIGMMVVIGIASYLTNLNAAGQEGRVGQSAFYMLNSRAWELAIGAGLALVMPSLQFRPRWLGNLFCAFGILGIIVAFLTLDRRFAYPGSAALLPVFSTAAVIAGASMAPKGILVRALGARPLAAVGLLSYSWYLWHWPLLAFARVASSGERALVRDASIAILALGLAWLTYVLVEDPIRQRRIWATWSSRKTLGASACFAGVLFGASTVLDLHSYSILNDPTHPLAHVVAATREAVPKRRRCNNGSSLDELRTLLECSTPAPSGKRILLWGDSHADHVANMVVASASARGIGMQVRVRGGCPPLPGMVFRVDASKQALCDAFNELVLREAEQLRDKDLVGVIIAARWTPLQGKPLISIRDVSGARHTAADRPTVIPSLGAIEANVRRTVDRLVALGLKVVILGPIPEQRHPAPSCVARRPPKACSVTREEQLEHRSNIVRILQAIGDGKGAVRFADPLDQLCSATDCPAVLDGVVLYKDDDHLSAGGAIRLAPWFDPFVDWLAHSDAKTLETGSNRSLSSAPSLEERQRHLRRRNE